MARSYKKHPGWKLRSPFMKNYANRRIRRRLIDIDEDWIDPVLGNRGFRKHHCSWDISDAKHIWHGGWEEYRKWRIEYNIAQDTSPSLWRKPTSPADWDEDDWYCDWIREYVSK